MRILSITAGAANMYCGSCLRDNALARELLARGHDVTLQPVYTPTVTDEENVSSDRVLFGGVSVYLQQHVGLFRRTPWLVDRLWDSKAFLTLLSKRSIPVDPSALGALTISTLEGERGFQRKEVEKLVSWLREEPRYDVINLPTALLISLAEPIRRATGRPVLVTLQGEDLFIDGLPAADRDRAVALIREQVRQVDLFLPVSEYYADYSAQRFGIPREKLRVAPLGVTLDDLEPTTRTRAPDDPFVVGYFARIAPEKSLHVLAEAYRILRRERGVDNARLEAAGYLAPEHRRYLATIEAQMQAWGLGGEFRYHGALDRARKVAFFHSIDVLSVPSTYREPKGLYLLEAMACSVPVVAPNHGAFPEMLARTSGGLLVRSGDPDSFAEGLAAIRRRPGQAREMGRNGAAGVRRHYSVARMADRVLDIYSEVSHAATARAVALPRGS
ncbi:MAG: glycosyltransferase family 4 protein [Vicinamibacterales bacterium]